MSKEQERQQARKLAYFEEYLDEYLNRKAGTFKVTKEGIREALMTAYLRGRGDKYETR